MLGPGVHVDEAIDPVGAPGQTAIKHQLDVVAKAAVVDLRDRTHLTREPRAEIKVDVVEIHDAAGRNIRDEPVKNILRRAVVVAVDPDQDRRIALQLAAEFIGDGMLEQSLVQLVVAILGIAMLLQLLIATMVGAGDPVLAFDQGLLALAFPLRQTAERIEAIGPSRDPPCRDTLWRTASW